MRPLDYEELFRPNDVEINEILNGLTELSKSKVSALVHQKPNFKTLPSIRQILDSWLDSYKNDSFLYMTYQLLMDYTDFKNELMINGLLLAMFVLSRIFHWLS